MLHPLLEQPNQGLSLPKFHDNGFMLVGCDASWRSRLRRCGWGSAVGVDLDLPDGL
jgi:hypothetical protein